MPNLLCRCIKFCMNNPRGAANGRSAGRGFNGLSVFFRGLDRQTVEPQSIIIHLRYPVGLIY